MVTMVLGGCGVSNALDGRDAEIVRLKYELNAQQGARAAELAYAERHVGIYRGCSILFNICSEEATQVGQELIKKGFTGDSSLWWWLPLLAKLVCVGGFLGMTLWFPVHLFFKFTGPAKTEIDDANQLIAGLEKRESDTNRKCTQTQQNTSAMKREYERYFAASKALQQANAAEELKLEARKMEIAKINRLKENFRQF